MATTYAGATIELAGNPAARHAEWTRPIKIVEKQVLSGAYAYSIDTGRGNWHWKVRGHISGATYASGLATLQVAQGITKRTLVVGSTSYSNVMLFALTNEELHDWQQKSWFDLEFTREA